MARVSYAHTQRAPLHVLVLLPGACMFGFAAMADGPVWIRGLLGAMGVLFVLLAFSFRWLRVVGEADALLVRFGPLPFFQRRIAYDRMRSAAVARSTLIDGWGIHCVGSRGWIWNLWGYDCVALVLDTGPFRIGSDDAPGLVDFLATRIGTPDEETHA